VVEGGVDGVAVALDRAAEFGEGPDAAALRPGAPPVEGLFPFFPFDFEYVPEAFFEQVGAVQAGIGAGDPFQLGLLAPGQVFRVLP
jgi:hypothetical protein